MRRSLFAAAVVALAASVALADDTAAIERELVQLTNAERVKAGLGELQVDARLTEAARAHARVMAEHREIAHHFDGEADLSERAGKTGLRFDAVAENVSVTTYTEVAPSAHRGFMSSPGHRANILGAKYNAVGIGVVEFRGAFYVTEDFAHRYDELEADAVVAALVRGIQALRADKGLERLHQGRDKRLAELACHSRVTTGDLFGFAAAARGAVVLTIFDPQALPGELRTLALRASYRDLTLEACALPTTPGGSGQFQVLALFY